MTRQEQAMGERLERCVDPACDGLGDAHYHTAMGERLVEQLRYIGAILDANKEKFAVPDHIAVKAEAVRAAASRIEALEAALRRIANADLRGRSPFEIARQALGDKP